MKDQEYVAEVLRTCAASGSDERAVLGAMGLAGEAGEVVDLLKKWRFQGHAVAMNTLQDELGDVLWYLVLLCDTFGFTLTDVMERNVAKMRRRYPDGFEVERSLSRSE